MQTIQSQTELSPHTNGQKIAHANCVTHTRTHVTHTQHVMITHQKMHNYCKKCGPQCSFSHSLQTTYGVVPMMPHWGQKEGDLMSWCGGHKKGEWFSTVLTISFASNGLKNRASQVQAEPADILRTLASATAWIKTPCVGDNNDEREWEVGHVQMRVHNVRAWQLSVHPDGFLYQNLELVRN